MPEDANTTRPDVVDRQTFEERLEVLRSREKAHTREGDAIAAARRQLPMVEVTADSPLIGPQGQGGHSDELGVTSAAAAAPPDHCH